MRFQPLVEFRFLLQFLKNHVRVTVGRWRAVIIKSITVLAVSPHHEYGLQSQARDAVGSAAPLVLTLLRFWEPDRALRRMVKEAQPARDSRADNGSRHYHAIVVIRLHPVVVENPKLLRVLVVDPERLNSARQRQHRKIVPIRAVYVPFAMRCQTTQY